MNAPPAVLLLAGGKASRLPGKLELDAGGVPLLLRVYRNVKDAGPVYLSVSSPLAPAIERELHCPIIVDRPPPRGPAAAMYGAFERIREPLVFVVAGDAPLVRAAVACELLAHWEPAVDAVVPVNRRNIPEPLCALYDRSAFLRAAGPALEQGSAGVRTIIASMRIKRIALSDERVFRNVNTPADRESLLGPR